MSRYEIYRAMVLAFAVSLLLAPLLIGRLKKLNYGQRIREDGPKRHLQKAGTPTMGGLIFLAVLLAMSLAYRPLTAPFAVLFFLVMGHGAIGFFDDFLKVYRRRSLGLKARGKLLAQVALVALFLGFLFWTGQSTVIEIPFFPLAYDLGSWYYLLVFAVIMGTSHGVNLTDGIDGLAAGTAILALVAYLFIALWRGLPELAFFCAVLTGSTFGFLIFNLHPARVFMGDVGSLSLGAALGALAILTKTEFYLVIIGGVFVVETISVILQVIWFQTTGRRIFRMAPLHHHFELGGWSEWQVVMGFWGLAFIFALVALMDLGTFNIWI
jgi:phospho-N-acetylmuramoyl-pentapeptide-transferase